MAVAFILFCLCTAGFLPFVVALAEDSWISKAPMQQARSRLGVATVNGRIYAIGGIAEDKLYQKNIEVATNEEYDPQTDTWTYKKPMPAPRSDFAIAACQGKIYCISSTANEVYDPKTDTWETKAPLPNATISRIQANVVDDKIYLIGGPSFLTQVYDPKTNTWTQKAPAPILKYWPSAVLDGKIYVIGGFYNTTLGNYSSVTQIYDTATDKWSFGAPSPTYFTDGNAAATTGRLAPKRIYVFDLPYGDKATMPNDPLYRTQVYNPETDSWINGTNIPEKRDNFGLAVLNDTFYAIGGYIVTGHTSLLEGNLPIIRLMKTNQQYLPFGYGTPDPSYETRTPTPTLIPSYTPTPTHSQTPTPTPSPFLTPTETFTATTTPSTSPTQQPNTTPPTYIYLAAAVSIALAVIAAAAAVVILRRKQND